MPDIIWKPRTKQIEQETTEAWGTFQADSFYEKPKEWWEIGMGKVAEGVSKVPGATKVLNPVGKAFEWIGENIEKPFAAIVTSPFSTSLPWKQGESWLEHQKREYEEWDAPTYVKGLAEFATPIWWIPWAGWVGKGAKALGMGAKVAQGVNKGAISIAKQGLAASETLDKVLFNAGWLTKSMEHMPVINKIVEAVGGPGVFITKKEAKRVGSLTEEALKASRKDALTKTKMEIVKAGWVRTQSDGLKSLLVAPLQVIETTKGSNFSKLMGMDSKGVVSNIVDKSGKSQYLYDVLEGAVNNKDGYKFLLTEAEKKSGVKISAAEKYIDTLRHSYEELYGLARKEGIDIPKEFKVHRIVKGKWQKGVDGVDYVKSEYGSILDLRRTRETMKDGVEGYIDSAGKQVAGGVDYGLNINEALSSTINNYTKRIARKRFATEMGKIGSTVDDLFKSVNKETWDSLKEFDITIDAAKSARRVVASLVSQKGSTIPGATLSKIRTELPEVGKMIDDALRLKPEDTAKIISRVSRFIADNSKMTTKELREKLAEVAKNPELRNYLVKDPVISYTRKEVLASLDNIKLGELDDAISQLNIEKGVINQAITNIYKEGYLSVKSAKEGAFKDIRDQIDNLLKTSREKKAPLAKEYHDFKLHYQGKQILEGDLAKYKLLPGGEESIFPREVSRAMEKAMRDQGNAWLEGAASISGVSRMMTAAVDLSAPFIQGAAVFGRNPVAWAKSTLKMLEFAAKPENFYKYMTRPEMQALRTERILAGGSSQTFEFFKALEPIQRMVEKVPGVGKGVNKVITQTYGRAETAFTGFGEVARNYMWQALKPTIKNSDEGLMDLARTIDRMTGVMSTEAIGISRTQQDFENAFMFFAPRYTRAGLTFLGDTLKGGMAGAEARKSLVGLAAGGATMYYGACKALGQEPNFDPSSSRFMTIKVGESHVGVGGIMTAIMRTVYDIGLTAAEDPVNLVKPFSDGKLNRWDNPFIKFLYGRTSPLTSTVYSMAIENSNYFGEPFESVKDYGQFMIDKVIPIASQQLVGGVFFDEDMPDVSAVAAEFGGLRRFPKSTWELIDEERDKLAIQNTGQPYDSLTDLDKNRINQFETVKQIQALIDESTVVRGDATDIAFLNREREVEAARADYEETLWKLQAGYDNGDITGAKFREEMQNAGYGLGKVYEHIDENPEYASVQEVFNEPRNLTDKTVFDVARSEFYTTLYKSGEFNDQYGLFDYQKYNEFVEKFKQKWGDTVWKYIQDYKKERDANLPPLAKEYQYAKEVLAPYWNIESELRRRFGDRAVDTSSKIQSLLTKMKKNWRLTHPEANRYYMMFYSGT